MDNKKDKPPDWQVEEPLDLEASLEELIGSAPFKEASDEHGHSATAATRIPFWLNRRVTALREMSGSPYDLNSDVLRDAIYLGMRVLHMRYKMSPDWDVETKLAAVVEATGAARRIRLQIEELVTGLEEMYRDGDTDKAAESLADYIMAAVDLEGKWHKAKVFNYLRENRVVRDIVRFCKGDIQKLLESGGE